jgi:hypothetical protein
MSFQELIEETKKEKQPLVSSDLTDWDWGEEEVASSDLLFWVGEGR